MNLKLAAIVQVKKILYRYKNIKIALKQQMRNKFKKIVMNQSIIIYNNMTDYFISKF